MASHYYLVISMSWLATLLWINRGGAEVRWRGGRPRVMLVLLLLVNLRVYISRLQERPAPDEDSVLSQPTDVRICRFLVNNKQNQDYFSRPPPLRLTTRGDISLGGTSCEPELRYAVLVSQ